jgi:hypothetical protein
VWLPTFWKSKIPPLQFQAFQQEELSYAHVSTVHQLALESVFHLLTSDKLLMLLQGFLVTCVRSVALLQSVQQRICVWKKLYALTVSQWFLCLCKAWDIHSNFHRSDR